MTLTDFPNLTSQPARTLASASTSAFGSNAVTNPRGEVIVMIGRRRPARRRAGALPRESREEVQQRRRREAERDARELSLWSMRHQR